jgi:hypothetical protein
VTPAAVLPPDFTWRQSIVAQYLSCPRQFELEHVLGVEPDHALDGYASIAGTALHAGNVEVLRASAFGKKIPREELAGFLADAFLRALEEAQEGGARTDPDRVGPALERLQGEQLDLVMALQDDPRIRAVEWRGLEEPFELTYPDGRRFTGTIDAWGVARERVVLDPEAPAVEVGEKVIVDWKTGTEVPLDYASRALNVQLAIYRGTLGGGRVFLGVLRDLARPKRPTDQNGDVIPKTFEEINPAYARAVGLDPAHSHLALEQCRKKPKDAAGNFIPKRIQRENPAWHEAVSRPKGPLFHECRLDVSVIARTVADAIDGARLGLFPASGALNGECRRCPFRARCAHQTS